MSKKIIFVGGWVVVAAFAAFMTINMTHYLHRPTPATWTQISAVVSKGKADGDAIAFFPAWLRGYAVDQQRFVGLVGVSADEIVAAPKTFNRVWVIDCFDAFDGTKLTQRGFTEVTSLQVRQARVRLYQRREGQVAWRLSDHLADIAADVVRQGGMDAFEIIPTGLRSRELNIQQTWASFRALEKVGVNLPLKNDRELSLDLGSLPAGDVVLCGGVADSGLFAMDFRPVKAVVRFGGQASTPVTWQAKSGWYCSAVKRPEASASISVSLHSDVRKDRAFVFDFFVVNRAS
jgi:hypothetical protein